MFNEPLTYNKNLHLDPRTKKLILGLLNTLLSVVPVEKEIRPEATTQKYVPDNDKDRKIEEALLNARKHADYLRGIIDPEKLNRYYNYLKDYREVACKIEELLAAINSYRDSAYQFSYKLAELLEEHIDMVSPSIEDDIHVKPEYLHDLPRLRVV